MTFVHLHNHTHYSFLQGLGTPKKLVARAKELGMRAVAITDAGNLYGAFEFYKYAKEAGIQPIIGVECTIASKGKSNRDKDNSNYQIVLLAKNINGYRNLIQMVSESYLNGFYFKPRIDFDLLKQYGGDLLALSGNHFGEIAQHVTTGKSTEFVLERIQFYQELFGKENFYLEIIEHPDRGAQTKINDTLVKISREFHIPLVATNDAYYLTPEDNEAQDLLSCIGDGRSIEDPDRATLIEGNYSLRSPEEMAEIFAHVPEAVKNTVKIAESIDLHIEYGKTLIPAFELDADVQLEYEDYLKHLPEGTQTLHAEEWNLRRICYRGLNHRYQFDISEEVITEFVHKQMVPAPEKKLSDMSLDELIERSLAYQTPAKKALIATWDTRKQERINRLEYELTVVDLMGFNGYFNIVSDFINWAKDHGIPVGPGRGSAAGAILAYVSGITDIDPLPYGLLFERFLNPARISMPDIDVDFADEDRDQVLEYVRNKYGADRVAQICTFGTMAARAAVKDAGKALGIPFAEMNLLASYIPSRPGTKLIDALQESIEFKQAYDTDTRYKKVIDQALKLEGSVRQLGVHACAVIIAPEPITNYCALQHPPKDTTTTVTQLSQYPLEELGLLKMDFLGLRNLTIMKRCLKIVKENNGVEVDLLTLDMTDAKVFKVFADGDTTGVFQFESAGMRKYLRELKPNTFEDIIVMVSLYRPGPMAYIPTYIARKYGKENVSYPHPSLETILRPTQGIAVYQEQIMQLVQAFAGFSLGEADILRRAIGKKKIDLLMEQKEKFIKAANTQGHSTDLAKYIFEDIIEPFAGYGFNKSHAACYALISYQTAYLKAYYPAEFMTALMVSDEDDMERITMEIDECTSKNIEILPPDINESRKHFTFIDKQNIRFGLKAIKGLGDGPIETIQKGRQQKPYGSLLDLMGQTGGDVINKKSLEALILSGALDRFGERGSLLKSIGTMTSYTKELEGKKASSQIGLFDMGGEDNSFAHLQFSLEKSPVMSYEEKITGEKLSIGYSVSGHGLDGLGPFIERRTIGKETAQQFLKDFELAELTRTVVAAPESGENPSDAEDGGDTPMPVAEIAKKPATPLPPADDVEKPKSKEKEKLTRVRYIGYIQSVRKIQTKTGKLMCVALCDGIHFRFSIVVFPKDYEALGNLLQDNLIAVVEGNLKCNEENGEISIIAQTVKTFTITTLRAQAQEMNLFDPKHKVRKKVVGEVAWWGIEAMVHTPVILEIPKHASKQDLLDLKEYLRQQEFVSAVHIVVAGNTIDTKFGIRDEKHLRQWAKERWGG